MKKVFFILTFCLFCIVQNAYAQLSAKVDERFELTSIVFALAGVPEYCQIDIPSYRHDIRKDLSEPYNLTPPINYMRNLNQNHMIGYNAVSTTASMLEIKNGKIRLQSQYDISKISEFDSRWNEELFTKYIEMLNMFYKESNFHSFFEKHRPLYELAEQRISESISTTTTDWFKSFYGKNLNSNLKIYINLVNGPNNYSIPEGVLLGVSCDKDSLPTPTDFTNYLLIHELGHHYMNDIFDAYWEQMKNAANRIFPVVKKQMANNAYGDAENTICEWLINLSCLMYEKESNSNMFTFSIGAYTNRGFIWMRRSVEFMENFYANRDKYPTINEFMPQLVSFLNYTADNFDLVEREFEHRKPYIKSIYPAPGSDLTDAKEIVITFSEPMLSGVYGFQGPPDNTECLPFNNPRWSDDGLKHILTLTPNSIKQGVTYGIKLHPDFFKSMETNFSMNDKYINLIFKQDLK